ncbi:MAG: phosphate ABC transporter ATP-binding protein [Candidatus Acetothermia bacterium]|jgi:phosphate transport system ATP-binding protein|nr:phosphate ABC transporter ATP-binding protein [Candidatus Acetothermia bacterium]MDH7504666.1 phosphate ABC transporter ATP-binding protein [Candidatus Acetothermia bacterium]
MNGIERSDGILERGPGSQGARVELAESHIGVERLNLFYKDHLALKEITVAIPDRQITCVIGPSGCGKTSLLKCLNRLIELVDGARVSGRVLVDGVDIYAPGVDVTYIRKKMGLLSQRPAPLPMSIYDNVAYGPRIHGIRSRKRLDELVERNLRAAGLWEEVEDRLKSPASRLSIGQQQRLCLARGLAVEPEIILADEPTSALDPLSAKRIIEIFRQLKQNYTVIWVTHNLRQARGLADNVLFLYLGELVEYGPAERFFNRPQDPRTIGYLQEGL